MLLPRLIFQALYRQSMKYNFDTMQKQNLHTVKKVLHFIAKWKYSWYYRMSAIWK